MSDRRRQDQETAARLRDSITNGLASGEGWPVTGELIDDLRARSFAAAPIGLDEGPRSPGVECAIPSNSDEPRRWSPR